jgi:hypothetical protein
LQIKTKIVSCHTADSKPVKQEVNDTVILPPLVFPAQTYLPNDKVAAMWTQHHVIQTAVGKMVFRQKTGSLKSKRSSIGICFEAEQLKNFNFKSDVFSFENAARSSAAFVLF